MSESKLAPNVLNFIDWCSKEIGKFEENSFNVSLWSICEYDYNIASPIEQLLYCAFHTVRRLNGVSEAEPILIKGKYCVVGLGILPQVKHDKYRVDFQVDFGYFKSNNHYLKSIIIECDSQEFHERSERERRYEKQRDRYLLSKDYKVLHFTGKEICDNPCKIAAEIISFITGRDIENLLINSNIG